MAVVAAFVRTAIRIKCHQRLFVDDIFLVFACLTLTAMFATVLYYTSTIYLVAAILDGQSQQESTVSPASADLDTLISKFRKAQFLRASLAWITIFAVKFSFLSFFHPLTARLPRLRLYWKVVAAVSALASVYCVTSGFLGCLGSGDETCEYSCEFQRLSDDINRYVVQCLTGMGSERLSFLIGFGIVLDILTDSLSP